MEYLGTPSKFRRIVLRFSMLCMLAVVVSSFVAMPAWSKAYQDLSPVQTEHQHDQQSDCPADCDEEESSSSQEDPNSEAASAFMGGASLDHSIQKVASKPDPEAYVPPTLHVPPEFAAF
jgi:hypothetical protein